MKDNLIIITGTDSGMGKNLSEVFIRHGYSVLATYLEEPGTTKSINIKVDIKKEGDIIALQQQVSNLEKDGLRSKCLIHNAGIALGGPIENLPLSYYRDCLEINLISIISITRKLLPYLTQNKGTVILHGSTAGRVPYLFSPPMW